MCYLILRIAQYRPASLHYIKNRICVRQSMSTYGRQQMCALKSWRQNVLAARAFARGKPHLRQLLYSILARIRPGVRRRHARAPTLPQTWSRYAGFGETARALGSDCSLQKKFQIRGRSFNMGQGRESNGYKHRDENEKMMTSLGNQFMMTSLKNMGMAMRT